MTAIDPRARHPRPRPADDGAGDFYDLAAVPARDREGRLEELVSTTHMDMSMRLAPEWPATSFQAWVRRRWLDDLVLLEAGCDPCAGTRGRRRAARSEDLGLGVVVVRRGRETVELGDAVAELARGDAVVWRSDRPARFRVHEPQVMQTLLIPMTALTEITGGTALFDTIVLDGAAPSTQLFTGYLEVLSRTVDQLTGPALRAARGAALELYVAAARQHAAVSDGEQVLPSLAVMQAWIDRRLPTGDVTPRAIAAAHGMSVRSVYRVFEETGETVSAFVRARRLARARRDLADRSDPISKIAVRWGFSDPSHFARAFRAQYGHTPRDYRADAAVRDGADRRDRRAGRNRPEPGRQMQAAADVPG